MSARAATVTVLGVTVALVVPIGTGTSVATPVASASSSTPLASAAPAAAQPGELRSTQVRTLGVPLTPDARTVSGERVVASLPPTRTQSYGLVGVTWEAGSAPRDLTVSLRSRVDGAWGPWRHLTGCSCPACLGTDVAPDSGDARAGTSPTWVGDADGVAVRVTSATGRAPTDLTVETIEPDRTALPARLTGQRSAPAKTPAGYPAMPTIVKRGQWGADPALASSCGSSRYGSAARAIAVHHTVNSNTYSRADSPALMRSIYAYHTQSQGWCDIGYNVVVDRFGTVYEGRRGGVRRPVRGAHAGDFNTDTVGVSMLGNFDVARVRTRMKSAVIRFVAWRLGTTYAPARGSVRVPAGTVPRIFGHRDVMSTACPGRYAYEWLPRLRVKVSERLQAYRSPIAARRQKLGAQTTGNVVVAESLLAGGVRTDFERGAMFSRPSSGTRWLPGTTRRAFQRFGGVRGRLGWPTSDLRDTPVDGVHRVTFQQGLLYRMGKRRAYVVQGRVMLRYGRLGGVTGRLGSPTSSTTQGDVQRGTFENGTITYHRRSDTLKVVYS